MMPALVIGFILKAIGIGDVLAGEAHVGAGGGTAGRGNPCNGTARNPAPRPILNAQAIGRADGLSLKKDDPQANPL